MPRKLKFGSPAWRKKYVLNPSGTLGYNARKEAAEARRYRKAEARREKAERAALARADRARAKRYNKPKRKAAQRKRTASHRRGTAAKKKRMREMIGNPPGSWTKVKAFRVVKKNGRAVLEVRK